MRRVFTFTSLILLFIWSLGIAQVPTPGTRLLVGKQHSLIVDDLILGGQGGAGYVIFQTQLDGRLTSGPISSTSLLDGSTLAKLTGPQTLITTRIKPRTCDESDDGTVAINYDSCNTINMAAVTQTTAFSNPTGTSYDLDTLVVRVCSAASQTVTWDTQFEASFSIALPTATTGSSVCDLWGFLRNNSTSKWSMAATTQGVRYGYKELGPNNVLFPTSNPMTLNNAENNPRLLADNVTSQSVYWVFTMPTDYGSTPTFMYIYSMTSVTSGTHHIDVSLMACPASSADCNTDSFDTVNDCNDAAVPGTVGHVHAITCSLTNNDSLAGGVLTRLKIARDTANDNAAGVSEILGGLLIYVRN